MNLALDILTIAAVSVGAFFFLAGTVGLLRFPDALTRLHALTKADNLGLGLVVLGLLPLTGGLLGGLKLICVWLLALLASATLSQLIARVARTAAGRARGPWYKASCQPLSDERLAQVNGATREPEARSLARRLAQQRKRIAGSCAQEG
jgi:multicomponent Na+:H+ antiporter subunit G